jgi:UDP-N-acetyl-D-glucosamine dehydrogenase
VPEEIADIDTESPPDRGTAVVVGQGYVGLPLAMLAVRAGYRTVGFDVDVGRVCGLAAGESPIEDVPSGQVAEALQSGRYLPTADPAACAGFRVAVIAVPTPLRERRPDLSHVEAAAALVAGHLRPGAIVALESTSYPGTTEEVVRPLLESGSGLVAGRDFRLGYSPERIDPGSRTWTLRTTPKLVSGIDPRSLRALGEFYGELVDTVIPVSSPAVAELAKLLENTFRGVNIALVNELAAVGAELGIDVREAIDAASTKPFGFMRFTPGPGVGGHCVPVDPIYLAWHAERRLGRPFRLIELADEVNRGMPGYVVQRLEAGLARRGRTLEGSRVLLLGLAYKRNTSDLRGSPALEVAELLARRGACVRAADPLLEGSAGLDVPLVQATPAQLSEADAVVLLTDHDAFDLTRVARCARYVLDTRHRLPGAATVDHL